MITDLIYLMGRLPDNTAVWGDIYYLLNVKTHPQMRIQARGLLSEHNIATKLTSCR